MKWKQVIAIICLLVLGTQVLPVKQLGALLSSNTMTEEIPHGLDDGKDIGKGDFAKSNMVIPSSIGVSTFLNNVSKEYFHFAVTLPDFHAGDIQTPPPNAA